jgi:UDP:flavonoid glycosyltransferase YjiC (YdhE family)
MLVPDKGNYVKKLLFTTLISNDLGLLTRSLPIARELRDRGYQVTFCTSTPAPKRVISDAGFDNRASRVAKETHAAAG